MMTSRRQSAREYSRLKSNSRDARAVSEHQHARQAQMRAVDIRLAQGPLIRSVYAPGLRMSG